MFAKSGCVDCVLHVVRTRQWLGGSDQWSGYTQINADFFSELGSPGSASRTGMTANDPQMVMDLQPMGGTADGSRHS